MPRSRDLRPLFRNLITATLAGSPVAVGLACGGAVEEQKVPSATGEGRDAENRTLPAPTPTPDTESRTLPTPTPAPARDGGRTTVVPVVASDAGVATWDAGTCGDVGKRPSQNWCDYYERQVPCGVAGSLSNEECAAHCMAAPASPAYCYINTATSSLICNACPGGRKPAGYELQAIAPGTAPMAAFFARLAELEAISIDAFALLEVELRAHGAEEPLLQRLRAARCDEERHALIMSSLASRFGAAVPVVRFEAPTSPRSLEAIATENVVEGCVRETYGALVAELIAQRAPSEELRKVFGLVADDEARHAELSWDLHEWLMDRLDEGARRRVDRARFEAVAELRREVARDGEALRELGVPSSAEAVRLTEGLAETLHAGA